MPASHLLLRFCTCLIFTGGSLCASSQVNSYAKVTGVAGTVLSLSNVNETFDTFEDGEYIVIMQMQDDVIGANTADAATFGDLSAIQNAGRYEIRQIASHTESAGLPVTITVTPALANTYNTGANSSVQIISFRLMSATNYTTTANISALAWDGNIGGVVALEVGGILTLAHNISANGAGFRGGARSGNYYVGGTACYTTPYRSASTDHGTKGEGIYKNTTPGYVTARAKMLTGGGGGIQVNTGGGGGGNFTAGGIGGPGWNGTAGGCGVSAGGFGYGGIALSGVISSSRIFMGGGGGGGQQNDGASTAGGNGGGIILVKAATLRTTGTCGLSITANGVSVPITPGGANDAAGGGGAAGTIVLNIGTYAIAAGCPLTIAANGGNGGTVNTSTHSGGGGGAQGVIVFSGLAGQPTTNVTSTTTNGTAGCNNNSVPCDNPAGTPSGINNSGILINPSSPLPIELLSLQAQALPNNIAVILWSTQSESNNSHFTLYRSADGLKWEEVSRVAGAGTTNGIRTYETYDYAPYSGISYYTLQQTDFNGHTRQHGPVMVEFTGSMKPLSIFPNPAGNRVNISSPGGMQRIVLHDIQGKVVRDVAVNGDRTNEASVDISDIDNGLYLVMVYYQNQLLHCEKLVIEK